jgi:phosphogluconate dehydratase
MQAAGGIAYLISQLLQGGLLHADVQTIVGQGLARYATQPALAGEQLIWHPAPVVSNDPAVLSPLSTPFSSNGGLKLLTGNLGRAVIKVSAVKPEHRRVEAQAVVFDSQEELLEAYRRGELNRDFVAVVRFQGPRANGMPELHSLTPTLANLQEAGFRVALVTDGRMSGASGKVPAAIHVTPECLAGGPLALVRDGDIICIDADSGILELRVAAAELMQRTPPVPDLSANHSGMGRELFGAMRAHATGSEQGATTFNWSE